MTVHSHRRIPSKVLESRMFEVPLIITALFVASAVQTSLTHIRSEQTIDIVLKEHRVIIVLGILEDTWQQCDLLQVELRLIKHMLRMHCHTAHTTK